MKYREKEDILYTIVPWYICTSGKMPTTFLPILIRYDISRVICCENSRGKICNIVEKEAQISSPKYFQF